MPNIALLAGPHLQPKAFGGTSGRQSKDTKTPRPFYGRGMGSYHHCHAKQLDISGLTYRTTPTLFSGMQKGVEGQKGDLKKKKMKGEHMLRSEDSDQYEMTEAVA